MQVSLCKFYNKIFRGCWERSLENEIFLSIYLHETFTYAIQSPNAFY